MLLSYWPGIYWARLQYEKLHKTYVKHLIYKLYYQKVHLKYWQAEHREQVTEPRVSPRRNELKSTNPFSETNESNYESSALCDQPTPVSVRKAYQQSNLDKTNLT